MKDPEPGFRIPGSAFGLFQMFTRLNDKFMQKKKEKEKKEAPAKPQSTQVVAQEQIPISRDYSCQAAFCQCCHICAYSKVFLLHSSS